MPRKTATRLKPAMTCLLAASALLTGCETITSIYKDDSANKPEMSPGDFVQIGVRQDANTQAGTASTNAAASDQNQAAGTSDTNTQDPATPAPTTGDVVSVNAMVGYINSEAVYADQIFDINLIAQLENFGRRYDGDEFKAAANNIIQNRLRGVIINKLILGEAELNLEDQQRQGIEYRVNQEREELLRFYGQGSISKARAEFRKQRGQELDDFLTTFREELVVSVYIRSKVLPKISVSQINIENYYEDNKAKYNKPDLRSFRVIRCETKEDADAVKRRLKLGEAFKAIAADPEVNIYNPAGAGVFNNGEPLPGDKIYGIEPVNKALLELEAGQHAGPILAGKHYYFTELISYTPGVNVALRDVQIEIEEALRALEFERQNIRFRLNLLKRGSYTDPETMGQKLLEIAVSRYDQ